MTTCTIDTTKLFKTLGNPFALADFVRPDYGDPAGPPPERDIPKGWKILVFVGDDAYDLGWFYVSDSMLIVSAYGEQGFAQFSLDDSDPERSLLPFRMSRAHELRVEIWNHAGDYLYFSGTIADPRPRVVGPPRIDGSDCLIYDVTCRDWFGELERRTIKKRYLNRRHGQILRDVIWRYAPALDPSEIDPNLGFLVERYEIKGKRPSQVLEHIAGLTDTTYVIDPVTRKIRLTSKSDAAVRFPVTITEANKYDYFDRDTFDLRRQNDVVHNLIEFWYRPRHTAGTVNVGTDSNIVVGHGDPPETNWDDLVPPLTFKLASSDAVYNVEANLSEDATQELRLSSPFAEGDAENQAYELRSDEPTAVYASDQASIALFRALGRGDGVFMLPISVDSNYFSFAEAKQFAGAMLSMSRPLPQGKADTYNTVWSFQPLQAGMVIPFNLPDTRDFVGDVTVQRVTIRDISGSVFPDLNLYGQTHPLCKIELNFDATLTSYQAQLRKLLMDNQTPKINLDDTLGKITIQTSDLLALKDCVHPRRPIPITSLLSLSDALGVRPVSGSTSHYTQQSYTLNRHDYAFTSP